MAYYNYDKIRSYNALMNIIMTNRGFGKTYGFKDIAIKNFLKNGKQFMYVRRYKTDISKEKIGMFFADIQEKYIDTINKFSVVLEKVNDNLSAINKRLEYFENKLDEVSCTETK